MKPEDPHYTLRLEPALRALAKNEHSSLALLTRRFNLDEGDLQAWLSRHNAGSKQLLGATIDKVKASSGSITTGRAPGGRKSPPQTAAATPEPIPDRLRADRPALDPTPAAIKIQRDQDPRDWLKAQRVIVTGTAETFICQVTPAIAYAWLKFNTANRTPSKAKIRRFTSAMMAHRWTVNGETIKFSVSGRLLDGQSRLMAVVESGATVALEVRLGLPDTAQESMDIGELRKGTHMLEMMGEKYPQVLGPALKLIWLLERGLLGSSGKGSAGSWPKKSAVMENFDVKPTLAMHEGLKKSVGWIVTEGQRVDRYLPWSAAAFFHYTLGTIDTKARDKFFAQFIDGEGLYKSSPIYALRELIIERKEEKRGSARDTNAAIVKAWNAFRAGKSNATLTMQKGEFFPSIDGFHAKLEAAA
jgi:hypothetical protein